MSQKIRLSAISLSTAFAPHGDRQPHVSLYTLRVTFTFLQGHTASLSLFIPPENWNAERAKSGLQFPNGPRRRRENSLSHSTAAADATPTVSTLPLSSFSSDQLTVRKHALPGLLIRRRLFRSACRPFIIRRGGGAAFFSS